MLFRSDRSATATGVQIDATYAPLASHTIGAGMLFGAERTTVQSTSSVLPAQDGVQTSDVPYDIFSSTFKTGFTYSLYVQDTGKGIAFEDQARAFDSFHSGDRRGAGLGLALVRSFIELHGGWVAISSEPGRGTTVTCHLHARAPTAGPPPVPPKPTNAQAKRRAA